MAHGGRGRRGKRGALRGGEQLRQRSNGDATGGAERRRWQGEEMKQLERRRLGGGRGRIGADEGEGGED